jgi:uncharacterized protein (TIGR02246 family)
MDTRRKSVLFIIGLGALLMTTRADAFDSVSKAISPQPSPRQVADAADETAIKALRRQMIDGWNRGSGAAFAEVFTEDGDFVAFDGIRFRGRQEIASTLQQYFDGIMNGSRLAGQVKSLRFLSSDVAVINAIGGTLMPGDSRARPEQEFNQTLVAVKRDGQWRFAAFHNSRAWKMEQQRLLDDYETLPIEARRQIAELITSHKRLLQSANMQASMP